MQDEGDFAEGAAAAPEPEAVALFDLDRAALEARYAAAPVDTLHAIKGVWRQGQGPLRDARAQLAGLALADTGQDPEAALREVDALLDALPSPFDPAAQDWAAMRVLGLEPSVKGSDPRLAQLLTLWEVIFGGYHKDGPQPPHQPPVYVPIFDYHVSKGAAPKVSLAFTADFDSETSTKFTLKIKHIGLTGLFSEKITRSFKGSARPHSFQIAVPVFMALTRYVHHTTRDVRFTARAVKTDAPLLVLPHEEMYQRLSPPTHGLREARFLNSDNLSEKEVHKIARGEGIEADSTFKATDDRSLKVDFKASAARNHTIEFTKTGGGALYKRSYADMGCRIEVYEAPA